MIDLSELKNSKMKVVFTKKDGTTRTMICTTNINFIPEEKHPSGIKEIKENTSIKKVYDLEKNDWRSFRIDSIISIEKIDE